MLAAHLQRAANSCFDSAARWVANLFQQSRELRRRAKRVELRLDAQPDEPSVAVCKGLFEKTESLVLVSKIGMNES